MKVICNRKELSEILAIANSICPSRSSSGAGAKPILQCLRMQARKEDGNLTVLATDLEVGIRCSLKEVSVKEEGDVAVNANRLYSIIRDFPDESVELTLTEDILNIQGSESEFKLYTLPAEEYPPVGAADAAKFFKILGLRLSRLFTLTSYAVAKETARYAINGVLLACKDGSVVAVGTDGRRLAKAVAHPEEVSEPAEGILSLRTVKLLERLADNFSETVLVGLSDKQAQFEVGNILVVSSLLEGKFPNYDAVIPKEFSCRVIVNTEAFAAALRRASAVLSEHSYGVKVIIDSGQMSIEARSSDVGEAYVKIIEVEQEGEGLQIAFNPDYMLEPLRELTTEEVTLEFRTPSSPILLRAGDDFTYVLMPVTI